MHPISLFAVDSVSIPGGEPSALVISAPVTMTIVALVIPLITGLLTKFTLPSWVKGLITIVLNAIAALIITGTQADGTAIMSNAALMTMIYGVLVSVVSYVSVYKPAGLTSTSPSAPQVQEPKLAPHAGVGSDKVV